MSIRSYNCPLRSTQNTRLVPNIKRPPTTAQLNHKARRVKPNTLTPPIIIHNGKNILCFSPRTNFTDHHSIGANTPTTKSEPSVCTLRSSQNGQASIRAEKGGESTEVADQSNMGVPPHLRRMRRSRFRAFEDYIWGIRWIGTAVYGALS